MKEKNNKNMKIHKMKQIKNKKWQKMNLIKIQQKY